MKPKILFILKRREDYCSDTHTTRQLSTGLFNSARLVQEMLVRNGIEAEIEVVIDNNCIDRLVTLHRPTHVIIEALWVVPQKFTVLQKLHPNVTWIIRMHSETPFVAGEGMAMDWLLEYVKFPKVKVAINSPRFLDEIRAVTGISQCWDKLTQEEQIIYLPNYYPTQFKHKSFDFYKPWVDIGCFGAVRPLKNHLEQAIAAVRFGDHIGKPVRFHINTGRIEMKGEPVLNNLRGLFEHLYDRGHELVIHEWKTHEQFLELCREMDIGLQVSFSETFNIVGADLIAEGIPLVSSEEIPWTSSLFNAVPTDNLSIVDKLIETWCWPKINVLSNQLGLWRYSKKTEKIWTKYFKEK